MSALAWRRVILLFLETRVVGRYADKISLPRICCYRSLLARFWVGKITLNLKHHSSTFNRGVEAVRDLPLAEGCFQIHVTRFGQRRCHQIPAHKRERGGVARVHSTFP